MAQRTVQGNKELGSKIKIRRNELGLTIEDAAQRAGVGTKTWSRYEAGESIRKDKCRGICKALNWRSFPDGNEEKTLVEEYKDHEAWSQFLADSYSLRAAASFAVGSDLLLDYIEQDLSDLSAMPVGSHIGQLDASFIKDELPEQFMMQYTYEFLYQMKCALIHLRKLAKNQLPIIAHSVIQELLLYLCNEEAKVFMELTESTLVFEDEDEFGASEDWVFDLFDDMDIVTFLYSDLYLDESHTYHFVHWDEQQFYMNHER